MNKEIDTFNEFGVSLTGQNRICILFLDKLGMGITKQQALILAAWLVTLADDDGEFDAILKAVQDT